MVYFTHKAYFTQCAFEGSNRVSSSKRSVGLVGYTILESYVINLNLFILTLHFILKYLQISSQ